MTVRFTAGTVLRLPLPSGRTAFGVMLQARPYMAFYAAEAGDQADQAATGVDAQALAKQTPMFIVAVHRSAYSTGRWGNPIGRIPSAELPPTPEFFRQDVVHPANCVILDAEEENTRKATPQECVGLERNAVWEAEHVESRLDDAYDGRPNPFVESLKVKLPSA